MKIPKPMVAKLEICGVKADDVNQQEAVQFRGVPKSGSYPPDGSDENNTFAKFSPCVDLNISIANPALLGCYEAGQQFYVHFEPILSEEHLAAIHAAETAAAPVACSEGTGEAPTEAAKAELREELADK